MLKLLESQRWAQMELCTSSTIHSLKEHTKFTIQAFLAIEKKLCLLAKNFVRPQPWFCQCEGPFYVQSVRTRIAYSRGWLMQLLRSSGAATEKKYKEWNHHHHQAFSSFIRPNININLINMGKGNKLIGQSVWIRKKIHESELHSAYI